MKKLLVMMISVITVTNVTAQVDTTKKYVQRDSVLQPKRYMNDSFQHRWRKDSSMTGLYQDSTQRNKWKQNIAAPADTAFADSSDKRAWSRMDTLPGSHTFNRTMRDQKDSLDRATGNVNAAGAAIVSDRVMMKDGEMQVVKNGVVLKMTEDITLPSGMVVTKEGTVKKKDGTQVKLKDGQYIEMDNTPSKAARLVKKKTGNKKTSRHQ